ncbi:MAG: L-erythro-3,5-diaminohexanoate dehydrogenase [Solirubrobacteraceae bacterium]
MTSLIEALGAARVLEPPGALPQAAIRLDAAPPLRPYEIEIDVDTLALDSTSFRQLMEACDGDPGRVGDAIMEIVESRGKMHNPVTGSGGILAGTIRAVGRSYPGGAQVGTRIVTLTSLTTTVLALDAVEHVEPGSPHVRVRGTAYLPSATPWAPYPEDVSFDAALAAFDVCNSASQTRSLITPDVRTVLVLGGGHAGLLALAAARDSLPADGRVVLIDTDESVCARARGLGLCDTALSIDLRNAVGALARLEAAGVPRADLTVVVVNATDCEAAAILLTADHGTVLFFSMATSFTKASLGADGISSSATMILGSGFAPDRGEYALELIGRDKRLQDALGGRRAGGAG